MQGAGWLLTAGGCGQIQGMRIPGPDLKDLSGLLDKVVGLSKEVVGEILDHDRLIAAGEAQQRKGTETLHLNRLTRKADARQAQAQAFAAQEREAAECIAAQELAAARQT
jgi:hypothetical protein